MSRTLMAGAAVADISPLTPQFLFGYPHVERISNGLHDPLLSSALYLSDGQTALIMVANDVIFIGKDSAARVRKTVQELTGVPAANIMVTATHTHSGPITVDMVSNEADPAVPRTDAEYVRHLERGIIEAATRAVRCARPAEVGLAIADGACVGTNRHSPAGPRDPHVPVLAIRDRQTGGYLAIMTVCSMHPTVLHEDSKLVSADFPGAARRFLQENVLGADCPVIYHTGPCGDQSPRHVTRANTFEEAERLGVMLGQSVAQALKNIQYSADVRLAAAKAFVELPPRKLPPVDSAREMLSAAAARLDHLRKNGHPRAEVRTAECDLFGAEETLTLASAQASGRLAAAAASLMPAEIQALRIGPWTFVGWPGETYVEFALAVKARCPDCFVIALANGELQGYLATQQAVDERRYEANNALFASPQSGERLVSKTLELLQQPERSQADAR